MGGIVIEDVLGKKRAEIFRNIVAGAEAKLAAEGQDATVVFGTRNFGGEMEVNGLGV